MATKIPDSWFDELRSRVNIVDVISDYVPLKQKGRKHWGLCPFHSEKTPSFSAEEQSQLYYCFGCHKGGNVIHFVMEMERMEFLDAVKLLSERAHLPLPDRIDQDQGPSRAQRDQMYQANVDAAKFYHDLLWTPEGAKALNYLYQRGLDDAGIRRFGLGATAQHAGSLTAHLLEKGYEFELLLKAGLCQEKEGRRYDAFRNRVMFPIISAQGRVLGFGARALGDVQPKYLNTADTPIFNKRQGVYALNLAKKERNLQRLLLVEGYMDVVSLRQRGISGVIATLGTALSEEQVRLIKRYAPQIWICYDGDAAGQKAILRALEVFEQQDVSAFVLDIPDQLDPDDFVRERGLEAFLALKPLPPPQYRMIRAADGVDLQTQEGRTQYAIDCCNILRTVQNPVELENYLDQLITQTGFTREVLLEQIGTRPAVARTETRRPAARIDRREQEPDYVKAEVWLIQLIINRFIEPDSSLEAVFITPLHAQIAKLVLQGESQTAILDRIPEDERDNAAGILSRDCDIAPDKAAQALDECLTTIHRHRLDGQIAQAQQALDTEKDPQKRRDLLALILSLTGELNSTRTARKE